MDTPPILERRRRVSPFGGSGGKLPWGLGGLKNRFSDDIERAIAGEKRTVSMNRIVHPTTSVSYFWLSDKIYIYKLFINLSKYVIISLKILAITSRR
jgi:hypothetical protein